MKCLRKGKLQKGQKTEFCPADEDALYENHTVFASDMKFVPIGYQVHKYSEPIRPVYEDILIAKLRPGQEIEMELFCEKGIGKTHAKWSPVSTAFYRLVPHIEFTEPIWGEDAVELKQKCPMNVFDIEDGQLFVKNAWACTSCWECIWEDKFEHKVKL